MLDHRLRRWPNIAQHWVCCLDDLPLAITVKLSVHSVTRNQVLLSSCHHTRRQHFNVSSPLPSEIPHPTDEHSVCRICQLQAWLVTLPVDGKTSRRWSNLASIFRARLSRLWISAVHLPFIWDVSLSERAPNPRYSVLVDTSTWQCEASYLVPSALRTHLTQQQHYMPAKMRNSPNVVSMLGQRRRRWTNIGNIDLFMNIHNMAKTFLKKLSSLIVHSEQLVCLLNCFPNVIMGLNCLHLCSKLPTYVFMMYHHFKRL